MQREDEAEVQQMGCRGARESGSARGKTVAETCREHALTAQMLPHDSGGGAGGAVWGSLRQRRHA